MGIWSAPSRFNFKEHNQYRELLGLSFNCYYVTGFYGHQRLESEIQHDVIDADLTLRLAMGGKNAFIGLSTEELREMHGRKKEDVRTLKAEISELRAALHDAANEYEDLLKKYGMRHHWGLISVELWRKLANGKPL